MYLQELASHENIIRLQNVHKAENDRDIYLVFDYMETDLHAVIRANILEDIHKQYVIYQVLKALKFMHSADLVHRDLKVRRRPSGPARVPEAHAQPVLRGAQPSNLLLNEECHMKVADFGLARTIAVLNKSQEGNTALTDYVATRWYRAPEILLGSTAYTKSVDMWSVGCILAEMYSNRPLFPGTSTMNQLERILEATGMPSSSDIDAVHSAFAATMLQSVPTVRKKWGAAAAREAGRDPRTSPMLRVPRRALSSIVPAPAGALDLVDKLLAFNPAKRISAAQALKHPFLAQFHTGEEPDCGRKLSIPIDDDVKYTVQDYRDKLYREVVQKKRLSRRTREGTVS